MKATAAPNEGIVCTPHPLATEAGLEVLRQGGTAAEAAVAAGAVLTVVCPHFCGLGGDGVWMVSDKDGLRSCVLGIGQAAKAVPTDLTEIPQRGPGSMLTTAGLVPSWETLLDISRERWHGKASVAKLMARAIDYAETGYTMSASQVFWLNYRATETHTWPGFSSVFLDGNTVPVEGDMFCQPDLGRILSSLASQGLESFRTGPVAKNLARGLRAAGSPITLEDLAATRATEVTPLELSSGDWTLYAPPPPTQGATTLLIRAILDQLDVSAKSADCVSVIHAQVEAVKQAFLVRCGIADPDFSDQSKVMQTTAEIAAMARRVSPEYAMEWPAVFQPADTVYLAVVDVEGRCVSGLQSTYFDWGSGVPVGDTGILWHNRGAAFDTERGSANRLAPGKRPFHTLNPGFAVRDDGETVLYGTQGADGQPQTLTVLLQELLVEEADVDATLRTPRFLLGRTFSDTKDTLKIEENIGQAALTALRRKGHDVVVLPELSPLAGQAGTVRVSPDGTKAAAHDPRGEGTAGGTAS